MENIADMENMENIAKYDKSPAHLKEAATHNQKRDEVGEHKVCQVVTEDENASSNHHIVIFGHDDHHIWHDDHFILLW